MSTDEIARAEQIERDFPTWDRPMSSEESALMDRFHEWRQASVTRTEAMGYAYPRREDS